MDTQIIRARYLGADGMPITPAGGVTAAALGMAAALERNRRKAAASPHMAQQQAKTVPAPAKATAPTFTGPNGRVEALAHAVANDPACKGKAQSALALLADDDLSKVTPAGMVKLLQRAPINMALPTAASPRDGWARARQHVAYTRGQAEAPSRMDGSNHGWAAIHAKLREQREN